MLSWATVDAIWSAAAQHALGPWTIIQSLGGGNRVSAASAEQKMVNDAIEEAEAVIKNLGQPDLLTTRGRAQTVQQSLDGQIDLRGYKRVDPSNFYSAAVATVAAEKPPSVSMFSAWKPVEIQCEIRASGGTWPAQKSGGLDA